MRIRFETPPASAQTDQGLTVRYAATRRRVPQWRWYLLLCIVLSLPAYFTFRVLGAILWIRAPAFVQFEQVAVRAGVMGRVVEAVAEGSTVDVGQALVTVLPPSREAEDETAHASERARLVAVREALRHAEEELELREKRLATVRRLFEEGAAPVADLSTAQAQWLATQSQLARLRGELALPRERRRPTAAVPAALSPVAGTVLTVFVKVSEPVERDSEVAVVRARTPPWIRAYVEPREAAECGPDTPVTLVFEDGFRQSARMRSIQAETRRMPADRLSPLEVRTQALVVDFSPLMPLSERHAIHNLPLEVYCRPRWLRQLSFWNG